jgi:hypothetical protein
MPTWEKTAIQMTYMSIENESKSLMRISSLNLVMQEKKKKVKKTSHLLFAQRFITYNSNLILIKTMSKKKKKSNSQSRFLNQ